MKPDVYCSENDQAKSVKARLVPVLRFFCAVLAVVVCCGMLVPGNTHAVGNTPTESVVRIAMIRETPPYVIEQPPGGIDGDIIRDSFANVGMRVEFLFAPLNRLRSMLASKLVDGIATFHAGDGICIASDVFSEWHDGLVVREGLADKVKSVADLKGLHVGTFPKAEIALGNRLAPYVESFGKRTLVFQSGHVPALLERNRLDAYIGDYWALQYAFKMQQQSRDVLPPYRLVEEFPPTPRRICFTDPSLRDIFNKGLKELRESGHHRRIIGRYVQAE